MSKAFGGIDISVLLDEKKVVSISYVDFFKSISVDEARVAMKGYFNVSYPYGFSDIEPKSLVGKEVTLYSVTIDKDRNVNIVLNKKVTIDILVMESDVATYHFSSEEIM